MPTYRLWAIDSAVLQSSLERTYSPPTHISLSAGSTKWNRLPPRSEKIGLSMVPILDGAQCFLQPFGIEHRQRLGRRLLGIRLKTAVQPFGKGWVGRPVIGKRP